MAIEGGTVKMTNKSPGLFGISKVIGIERDNALCSQYLLDKDLQGDEQPNELIPTKSLFPLRDLIIIKK